MATKSIAWNNGSGNITLTYQGQGDGLITVESDENDIGSARSQTITIQTVGGAVTRNLTVSQDACPFPVNTTKSYSYTGSYQEVTLPAGKYKLQCWGAQGGSNGTNSSYSITAKDGGKGGYSEGFVSLSQKTTMRVYVGGQGSSSAGGFNGGGSTTETSQYSTGTSGQTGYTFGYSKMGGGGGATDIRLSDGALLSRMIVAGGGAGGAMCYKAVTTTTTTWTKISTKNYIWNGTTGSGGRYVYTVSTGFYTDSGLAFGKTYKISVSPSTDIAFIAIIQYDNNNTYIKDDSVQPNTSFTVTKAFGATKICVNLYCITNTTSSYSLTFYEQTSSSSTSTSTDYQVGGVGGGTQGGGYSSTYVGKQESAGSGGSFGTGANQTSTNYPYCSGAGGGGWYGGGGGQKSDSSMTYCKYSGGGSGFVNTAASAENRPSGYTGLELDSGETKDGNTSFPNTAGTGNETGHSGNGYAKITRLA